MFIHFCEAYLGILPQFNLFRHLFWFKKKGGGGSKVVSGVYLQLHDGMVGEYITMPLNTSLKGWNARWFYMKQSHPAIQCDIDQISKNQKSWSEKPTSIDMEQVKELLELMTGMKMSGLVVEVNFIMRRIQPYKERAHPGFDFKGDIDDTRERTENLAKEAMLHRAAELFAPNMSYTMPGQPKSFNYTNPPPQIKISTVVLVLFIPCWR